MTENEFPEPHFSPDFAARVLSEADAMRARRRLFRSIVAGSAFVGVATAGTIFWATFSGPNGLGPRPEPALAAASDTAPASSAEQIDQPDALAYLFPDAGPVARFAATYSDDMDDPRGSNNDAFFDQDLPAP